MHLLATAHSAATVPVCRTKSRRNPTKESAEFLKPKWGFPNLLEMRRHSATIKMRVKILSVVGRLR